MSVAVIFRSNAFFWSTSFCLLSVFLPFPLQSHHTTMAQQLLLEIHWHYGCYIMYIHI